MNYIETKNEYVNFRKNMAIAERDRMEGNIMQIKPLDPLRLKPTKIKPNKPLDIPMTPKRKKILFAREYFMVFNQVTINGLSRRFQKIIDNRKKPNKQVVKDFREIIKVFIDLGLVKKNGKSRYSKIINPDKIEELRNGIFKKMD